MIKSLVGQRDAVMEPIGEVCSQGLGPGLGFCRGWCSRIHSATLLPRLLPLGCFGQALAVARWKLCRYHLVSDLL